MAVLVLLHYVGADVEYSSLLSIFEGIIYQSLEDSRVRFK